MTTKKRSTPSQVLKPDSFPADSPFIYRDGELYCEQVPLKAVASAVDTPVYIYSRAAIMRRSAEYLEAARGVTGGRATICYAVKANANPAIMRILFAAGLGADVTSGGELFLALHAGAEKQKIIFSGTGKTPAEIAQAQSTGIRAIHVESEMELATVAMAAARLDIVAPIGVRVNPNIKAETHPNISTGLHTHKFGVSPRDAISMFEYALSHEHLRPIGLAAHIGSQIASLVPFVDAANFLVALAAELEAGLGITIEYIDVGGGLGIDYQEPVPDPTALLSAVGTVVSAAGYELVAEPGRSIIGPAGGLLTRVLYLKQQGEKRFVIVDAGMNDLIRPALYQAHHPVIPVVESAEPPILVDIVGPVCETGDYLARGRPVSPVEQGSLLCVFHAGAYGYAMSSNYNGRMRPAEVLVEGDTFRVIRERQTYAALLDGIKE